MKKCTALLLALSYIQIVLPYAVPDNRYIPFHSPVFIRSMSAAKSNASALFSGLRPSLFFINGNEAYASGSKEKRMIPEILGVYDQRIMNDALLAIGQTTPLLAQWQLQTSIEWQVRQRIEGFGVQLGGEYAFTPYVSAGFQMGMLRVLSDQEFILPRSTVRDLGLLTAQEYELDRERRAMFNQLGLTESQWAASGLLDTTVYGRIGRAWEYQAKCRQVSLSLYSGMVIPTGLRREPANTSSFAFGSSNGSLGLFIGTDNQFELKEDMVAGLHIQLSGRTSKITTERLPVKQENYLFGALQGQVAVDPGVTLMIRPSVMMGNLRDGFDIGVAYALVHHGGDTWKDLRTSQSIPSNLNNIHDKTHWNSEYVTLTIAYNPAKVVRRTGLFPSVYFSWDIPVHMIKAHEVSRTHALALGVELEF